MAHYNPFSLALSLEQFLEVGHQQKNTKETNEDWFSLSKKKLGDEKWQILFKSPIEALCTP
jgi:hypothetical protein